MNLSRVVAPPYDIISPADQKRFYQQDPHNVVRLIAGEVHPSDTPQDNKYTRAAAFFREWLADGTLRINQETVGWEALRDRLEQIFKLRANRTAFVRGESVVEFQVVARVIDVMRAAGVSSVGLMTPALEKTNETD